MERRRVGASSTGTSSRPAPAVLTFVLALGVAGPSYLAHSVPGAVCAVAIFGAALWRPHLTLVGAVPGALLLNWAGLGSIFLLGVPLMAALFAGVVSGRLRVDGRRHLALAGLALWIAGSVLLIPDAPFGQTSRVSDAATFALGLVLAAFALSVGPSPALLRAATILGAVAVGVGLRVVPHATDLDGRPTAFGLGTNSLGLIFAMGLACAVVELHAGRRLLALLAVPVMAAGLWTTQSRGALIALGGGLAAYATSQLLARREAGRRLSPAVAAVLIAGAVGAVVYVVGGGGFGNRSTSSLEVNNESRSTVALYAVELALGHPVDGVGYGNFASHALEATGAYLNTHNDYLRLAAETGLPGLVLFLVVLGGTLGGARSPEWHQTAPLLVTFLVGQLFLNNLSVPAVAAAAWVAVGLLSSERLRLPAPAGDRIHRPSRPAVRALARTGFAR